MQGDIEVVSKSVSVIERGCAEIDGVCDRLGKTVRLARSFNRGGLFDGAADALSYSIDDIKRSKEKLIEIKNKMAYLEELLRKLEGGN